MTRRTTASSVITRNERLTLEVAAVQIGFWRGAPARILRELARRLPQPAEGVLPQALGKLSDASLRTLCINLTRLTSQLQTRHAPDARSPLGDL